MLDISFAKPSLPNAGALVILVDDEGRAEAIQTVDGVTGGAVSRALAAAEFKGKAGSSCMILAPGGSLARVLAVGIGKRADLTDKLAEEAGGNAIGALARSESVAIAAEEFTPAHAASLALGATLRAYRFDRYRTTEKPEDKPLLAKLAIHSSDPAAATAAWSPREAVANGVLLARDLVSEPPNVLFPEEMARRCSEMTHLGLKVDVLGLEELTSLGFGALLGVSQGSAREPRVVVMHWNGAGGVDGAPIAFVGKGVTFDTGGISIKPAAGMEDMKFDMAGAAAVIGAMAALAGRHARVDAIGIVGLVENMPSGTAQRPGDVVKTYSGQTVEIINTDAEGRLVLADVLWYCQEKFAPRFMIDLATLTGAMIVSLGHEYGGMYCSDEELAKNLLATSETTGEKLWRMPLHDAYDRMIKSDIADMKNTGGRPGGANSAAHFIQRFTNKKPWAHLDIAGTAWSRADTATVPKGATAYGVRLLDRLVAEHYES